MNGRTLTLGCLVTAIVIQLASVAPVAAGTPSAMEGVPAFGHVFVIIGENAELGNVNKSNSPYLIGTLEPVSAWHTNYFALTHNSLANYIGMTSGQFTLCEQLDDPPADCHQDVENLFHQLDVAGLGWQSWMESMPVPCDVEKEAGTLKDSNTYRVKHNPAVYYDDVEGQGGTWSATAKSAGCLAQDVPAGGTGSNDMSAFDAALATGQVGRFNLLVPNQCEDAHDNCKPPSGNPLAQFDDFLAREVPKIQASPAFGTDGVLIVVFDEGAGDNIKNNKDKFGQGGRVVFAVSGPLVRPGTYPGVFDHYSFLRTMEDGFGLGAYAGNAALVDPINGIWK
jgi:phosphatidylinositol-3-phosphatase